MPPLLGDLVVSSPGGSRRCRAASKEVPGGPELQNGGLRALEEAWDDFLLEALETGGKPSTRLPPGKLVENSNQEVIPGLSQSSQATVLEL